jgi:hypothetical protein
LLREEPRASARGFFQRKSLFCLGAMRQRTSLVRQRTSLVRVQALASIHHRSSERRIPAFSRKRGRGISLLPLWKTTFFWCLVLRCIWA